MKKQLVALALIIGLSMATAASAEWGRGGRGYGDCPQARGYMMQGQGPGQFQQLDQATQDKIAQFFNDTRSLHKEMAMKRAEKKALMRSDNPDAQAVARLTGELFDLRVTMQDKAQEAGVAQYVGPGRMGCMGCMGGMGHGRGRGQGPGMGMGMGMQKGGVQQ
jgi:hypothetical protein